MGQISDRQFIEEIYKSLVTYMEEAKIKRGKPKPNSVFIDYMAWRFERQLNDETQSDNKESTNSQ